jgi:hypothetical protein
MAQIQFLLVSTSVKSVKYIDFFFKMVVILKMATLYFQVGVFLVNFNRLRRVGLKYDLCKVVLISTL